MIDTENQSELAEYLRKKIGLALTINLRCIGRRSENGGIIGVVGYDSFTNSSVQMHVASEGNWLSRDYLWAMFDYPFRVCGLRVAFVHICSTNLRSLRLCTRLGFKYEHTLKDFYLEGDAIIMSMRAENCRYLKEIVHG